jgi:aryl-alcohol dehydrogenase-like predicted oxidoreductase
MDLQLTLGRDLEINRLGFGAMRLTGEGQFGPPRDKAEALAVLRRAVELGVNFIDTADSYGPNVSEELIAEALYPYADDLVIATKGGFERPAPHVWVENGRPEHLRRALDGSLQRLRLERIDLWQLHRIDEKVPRAEQFDVLAEFVRSGKVRHVGLSEVSVQDIEEARGYVPIVSVQNRYNIYDRDWDDVVDYCEREGIAFIPWAPLDSGRLKQRAISMTEAIAWLLHRSPIMLPIPGTSRVKHLEENMRAAELDLSDRELAKLGS